MTYFNPNEMQDRVLDRQRQLIREAAAERLARQARAEHTSLYRRLFSRIVLVLSCLHASLTQPLRPLEQRSSATAARQAAREIP